MEDNSRNGSGQQNYSFKIEFQDGDARCGQLKCKSGVVKTPGLLISTRRGGAMNLSSDLLQTLKPNAQALQLSAMHFLKCPNISIMKQYGEGGDIFLNMQDWIKVVTYRDTTNYEYLGGSSSNKQLYVTAHGGGEMVSPDRYMDIVQELNADICVTLADEVAGDVNQKRAQLACTRTAKWCQQCVDLTKNRPEMIVLASITGGQFREKCFEGLKNIEAVDGYHFPSCGLGETMEEFKQRVKPITEKIYPEKFMLVSGMDDPLAILEAVSMGFDLFDSGYIARVTSCGCALTFPLNTNIKNNINNNNNNKNNNMPPNVLPIINPLNGQDDTKINLWATYYRESKEALVKGCTCYTCCTYSRAYIHHLLCTHEMLAPVLLELHNTHHMMQFFSVIQRSIEKGEFYSLKQNWLDMRTQAIQQVF